MAYYGDVSEDVLLGEILLMLPVKSLVRFRCVSKSWYALLTSSYFINKHTQRCNRDNNNLTFLVSSYESRETLSLLHVFKNKNKNTFEDAVLVKDGDDHVEEAVPSLATLKSSLSLTSSGYEILGPINGVYCVINFEEVASDGPGDQVCIVIHLCNPSLRDIRILPRVPKVYGLIYYLSSFGFGFDSASVNNGFKVVFYSCVKRGTPLVFIYTSDSDRWRELDTSYIDLPHRMSDDSHFLRNHGGSGVIHWLAHDTSSIVSFDLGTEVFSHTSMPYPPTESKFFVCHIDNLNESLVVILEYTKQLRDQYWKMDIVNYEVWEMKDYRGGGVQESWSKLHNLEPIRESTCYMCFLKIEEFLFYTADERELVLYDRKQIKRLPICNVRFLTTYKESLVSVGRN